MSKKWIAILVGAIIILLIGFNIWKSKATSTIAVETTTTKEETMSETIKIPGTLVLTEEQIIMYEADKGEIAEVFVEENEEVKKGDKLLRYENELYEIEKKQNEMHIKSLHLEIDSIRKQRRELDNQLAKDKENELLKQERDQLLLQEQLRNIDLDRANLEKEQIEKKIKQLTVTAEVDGVILQLNEQKNARVLMGEEPLIHIASMDEMLVKGSVTEYEVLKVEPNQTVRLTADTVADKEWKGKVESIANSPETSNQFGLDSTTEAVKYTLYVKPNEEIPLKPGFNMLIDIITKEAKVPTLPISAIQQEDDETFVYVVEDGKVQRADVKIGLVDIEKMEIVDGVTADDEVIIKPPENIAIGMEVKVK
jgi:HlyD family secretion protein